MLNLIEFKQKRSKYGKKYYKKNKKKINEDNINYARNHPIKIKRIKTNWRKNNPIKIRWYTLLNRAKVFFTFKEFYNWYIKQPKKCIYCGIEENKLKLKKYKLFAVNTKSLTIDRKNNNKGYILNNIALACGRCNLIKSNFFSFKEMLNIGRKYVVSRRN